MGVVDVAMSTVPERDRSNADGGTGNAFNC
jgi:hypothetical protein